MDTSLSRMILCCFLLTTKIFGQVLGGNIKFVILDALLNGVHRFCIRILTAE